MIHVVQLAILFYDHQYLNLYTKYIHDSLKHVQKQYFLLADVGILGISRPYEKQQTEVSLYDIHILYPYIYIHV